MGESVEIIVSGHLCLDMLPMMDHVPLEALSKPGRLYEVGTLSLSTGGAVSNTGLALHKLGVEVRLMASVGDDLVGRATIDFIEQRDPALCRFLKVIPGLQSSYTVVLSPGRADRIFLHCPGANTTFSADDVDYAQVGQAKLFHLGYPPILPRMVMDDGAELERLFRAAKTTGVITSLDMSLPDPDGASGRADWQVILERTLPYVDIFIPSIEEILFMARRADYNAWHGEASGHLSGGYLAALADELLAMGPAIVGFKLGAEGFYLRTADADTITRLTRQLALDPVLWAKADYWHPAFEVEVVGTTGAGDSAYAGFLAALLRGYTPQEAARWACAVGACNVEAADATSGIRTWAETEARLRADWPTRRSHFSTV